MLHLWLAIACLTTIYAARRSLLRLLFGHPLEGLPSPPGPHPISGDLAYIQKGLKRCGGLTLFLEETVRQLGPVYQFRVFNKRDYTTAISVTQDRSGVFERAISASKYFGLIIPTGMIVLDTDDQWKTRRRVMGPAMTAGHLSKLSDHIHESLDDLVSLWKAKVSIAGERAIDVSGDTESVTMDIICGLAFGESWGCCRVLCERIERRGSFAQGIMGEATFDAERPDLARAVHYLAGSTGYPVRQMPALIHFLKRMTPTYRRHASCLDQFVCQAIGDAQMRQEASSGEKAPSGTANILDIMLGIGTLSKERLAGNEIKDELLTYLVAGTDTTGSTLSWWLKLMTDHPRLQRKLREYMQTTLSEDALRKPRAEDLTPDKAPYLEAMVHETLRWARVATWGRRVLKDTVVCGRLIPKGTNLIFPLSLALEEEPGWGLASPSESKSQVGCWAKESAGRFDPDRWITSDGSFNANVGPSLPFGHGVRGCFGKNLALLELRICIVRLNQEFFFSGISSEQSNFDSVESVVRKPKVTIIRPRPWES